MVPIAACSFAFRRRIIISNGDTARKMPAVPGAQENAIKHRASAQLAVILRHQPGTDTIYPFLNILELRITAYGETCNDGFQRREVH